MSVHACAPATSCAEQVQQESGLWLVSELERRVVWCMCGGALVPHIRL